MGKLEDFDLDITVKKSTRKGVEPAVTSLTPQCTSLCRTAPLVCRK